MHVEEPLVKKRKSRPERCARCVAGIPKWCGECWLSCVVEIKDTIVYCFWCWIKGPPHAIKSCVKGCKSCARDPKGKVKECCKPEPGCCGRTHPNKHFHICYNKPIDWAKLCCFFAMLYTYLVLFFVALMLIYMGISGYITTFPI